MEVYKKSVPLERTWQITNFRTTLQLHDLLALEFHGLRNYVEEVSIAKEMNITCLLYTSDAADDRFLV